MECITKCLLLWNIMLLYKPEKNILLSLEWIQVFYFAPSCVIWGAFQSFYFLAYILLLLYIPPGPFFALHYLSQTTLISPYIFLGRAAVSLAESFPWKPQHVTTTCEHWHIFGFTIQIRNVWVCNLLMLFHRIALLTMRKCQHIQSSNSLPKFHWSLCPIVFSFTIHKTDESGGF